MSSLAAVSTTEGQGRLWERLSIQDMNIRIEHLMQSLTKSDKYDPALAEKVRQDYENDLKNILDKINVSVDDRMKDWENAKQVLNHQNNELKNENDMLKNDTKRLKLENKNLTTTNQKLQTLINDLSTNKPNDNHSQIRDMQKLKANLENEKNVLINENIQLTTDNKNLKLQLQKAQNQIDTGKMELKAVEQQNKDLTQLLKDIRGEIERQYKEQIDGLNKELTHTIKERNDKDSLLKELQTKYDLLQAKCDEYHKLLQDQMAKFAKKKVDLVLNKNDDFHQKLQSIRDEYEHDLRVREAIWEKAKEESLKTLNEAYRTLKEGLGKQNEQLRASVQQYFQNIEELKKELNKIKEQKKQMEKDIADKDERITKLMDDTIKNQKRIEELNNQIFEFEKEIAQYKIVWNHYFGLDMPLREQILIGKEKLNRFEQQHNVSAIPLKKSKIEIKCLDRFGHLPLRLGELPYTNDNKDGRFDLINVFSDKELLLKGCYLRNENGDRIKLPEDSIRPLQAIGFSIGNKKVQENDILIPATFCTFNNEKNKLVIEDTCKSPHCFVLYPVPVQPINNLDKIAQLPLSMNSIKMDSKQDGWRGFELKNTSQQCILLQNMFIARQKTNFKQQIPERPMNPGDTMRFVFARDNNSSINHENVDDIIINERDFGKLDVPDKLLMMDKDGHFKVLHDGAQLQNIPSSCLVM